MKRICNLLIIVLVFSTCTKQGPSGPEGPVGPQGPPATNPVDYFSSGWVEVTFAFDEFSQSYFGVIDTYTLTSNVLTFGDVRLFINIGTEENPALISLPYTEPSGLFVNATFETGRISLFSNWDPSTIESDGQKYRLFKFLVSPSCLIFNTCN